MMNLVAERRVRLELPMQLRAKVEAHRQTW
jgi:hypothetical protein